MTIGLRLDCLDFSELDEAVFNYATHLQRNKVECLIYTPADNPNHNSKAISRMSSRFKTHFYTNTKEFNHLDALYSLEYGVNEYITPKCPYLVHSYGEGIYPHGDRFAVVSPWMGRRDSCSKIVPYMVEKVVSKANYRKTLGIPHDAIVIGRLGEYEPLEHQGLRTALIETLSQGENLWFLFENVKKFVDHPRIKFKESSTTSDRDKFINTCNVGLDLSLVGSTFGYFNLLFAINNKPVIIYANQIIKGSSDMLKHCNTYEFHSGNELSSLLKKISVEGPNYTINKEMGNLHPTKVMETFNKILLPL